MILRAVQYRPKDPVNDKEARCMLLHPNPGHLT